jgi:protein-L-isoaspartate(D-aspartate) O-methyltransferase
MCSIPRLYSIACGARALLLAGIAGTALACGAGETGPSAATPPREDDMERSRVRMVRDQIERRSVTDAAVLEAMRRVPRHRFVPPESATQAYDDHPLPIGSGQTISQPFIVALMTELARPAPDKTVLEIGTGSGYQAAVLAECFDRVFTIEIIPSLGRRATGLLEELGYDNVAVRVGDGYDGWPDEAPFDAIVVTAAPDTIPRPLLEQLAPGGRLVIPVGIGSQDLVVVTRTEDGFERKIVTPVRFVPMTGKAQRVD